MIPINKATIINNFEWIRNNQIAMDMLEVAGLKSDLINVAEKIKTIIPDDIELRFQGDLFELEKYDGGNYYKLYSYFKQLNRIQTNPNTYMPNLAGIYLVANLLTEHRSHFAVAHVSTCCIFKLVIPFIDNLHQV